MSDEVKKFAGIGIRNEISLGNLLTAVSMFAFIIAFGISLQKDIEHNSEAIERGVLPDAERRITALETQLKIQIESMRSEIERLRQDVRSLTNVLRQGIIRKQGNGG